MKNRNQQDKKAKMIRKLNRRQSLAARFQGVVDELGINRRMKKRYQF